MTPHNECDNLDAYLAGDLLVDAAARFESHLQVCAECRDAVDEQKWIDDLLQSPLRVELEQSPETLLDSVRSVSVRHDNRTRRFMYGFAAAAVLLIGVGWVVLHRSPVPSNVLTTQHEATSNTKPAQTAVRSEATFVASSDAIVVPVESSSTDVTVVQVYPTTDTERRWRFEQSLSTLSTSPNGG